MYLSSLTTHPPTDIPHQLGLVRMKFSSLQDDLWDAFRFNPLTLQAASGLPLDAASRARERAVPKFYDRHVSYDLCMKRLVHVPNLHTKIASGAVMRLDDNVANAVEIDNTDGESLCSTIESTLSLASNASDDLCVRCSTEIRGTYAFFARRLYLPVASALAHPQHHRPILEWSDSSLCRDPAISAASLRLSDCRNPFDVARTSRCGAIETVRNLEKRNPFLATWDTVSLKEGRMEVMLGIQRRLQDRISEPTNERCTGGLVAKYRRIGGDLGIETHFRRSGDLEPLISEMDHQSRSSFLALSSNGPDRCLSDDFKRTLTSGSDRFLDAALRRCGSSLECATDLDHKIWSSVEAHDALPNISHDEARQLADDLLTHAWAQSLRQDTTFLTLNAGNFEFVGICDRKNGTLYLSDLLHVPVMEDPGYGQLQVGLYLAALEDRHRRETLHDWNHRSSGLDNGDSAHLQKCDGIETAGSLTRPQRPDEFTALLLNRDMLMVAFCYDIYDSPRPSLFVRRISTTPPRLYTAESRPAGPDALRIKATSFLGKGSTGIVHGGRMEAIWKAETVAVAVVIKLAFCDAEKLSLLSEYRMYATLENRKVKGIPQCYGSFSELESGGPTCLVLSFEGTTLADNVGLVTHKRRDEFINILGSMHKAGVLHNDIRPANLAINDEGHAVILDFSQARLSVPRAQRDSEMTRLKRLLDGCLERNSR